MSVRSFFLDESCTDMLHISGFARRLTQSKGSYSTWAERRAEEQKASKREKELREVKVGPCPEAARCRDVCVTCSHVTCQQLLP